MKDKSFYAYLDTLYNKYGKEFKIYIKTVVNLEAGLIENSIFEVCDSDDLVRFTSVNLKEVRSFVQFALIMSE